MDREKATQEGWESVQQQNGPTALTGLAEVNNINPMQPLTYCRWTKSCTTLQLWETAAIVGTYRCPGFLRWCRIWSLHSITEQLITIAAQQPPSAAAVEDSARSVHATPCKLSREGLEERFAPFAHAPSYAHAVDSMKSAHCRNAGGVLRLLVQRTDLLLPRVRLTGAAVATCC